MKRQQHSDGGIVVGIDGSPSSLAALRWALDQAERTGATLRAVHAWERPSAWGQPVPVYPGDHLERDADERLAQIIEAATADRRPVEVSRMVVKGDPASALLDESEGADLLVVGSRGHGGFAGALLGSVSQKCVHHATCPVVVVRAEE